ncbi:MAG: helix-turn-helix domain-containing protein [Promethearchaeota archaeon]
MTLKIRHKGCWSELTKNYPTVIMSAITTQRESDTCSTILRITGEPAEIRNLLQELRKHSDVGDFQLKEISKEATIRLVCLCTPIIDLIQKAAYIKPDGVAYKNGFEYWEVMPFSKDSSKELIEELKSYHAFEVIGVGVGKVDITSLTKKQKEVIRTAFELGYYDFPRRITLTQLSEKLNMSPSTLSEILRTAHKKMASKIVSSF